MKYRFKNNFDIIYFALVKKIFLPSCITFFKVSGISRESIKYDPRKSERYAFRSNKPFTTLRLVCDEMQQRAMSRLKIGDQSNSFNGASVGYRGTRDARNVISPPAKGVRGTRGDDVQKKLLPRHWSRAEIVIKRLAPRR